MERMSGLSRGLLWALLVICGGISLTLSVTHAVMKVGPDPTRTALLVAILVGIAPIIAAALLAHLVTDSGTARWLQIGGGLVFLGAMVLSVDAQAETVHPIVGDYLDVLFPIVMDYATVIALLGLAGVGRRRRTAAEQTRTAAAAAPARATRTDAGQIRTATRTETRTDGPHGELPAPVRTARTDGGETRTEARTEVRTDAGQIRTATRTETRTDGGEARTETRTDGGDEARTDSRTGTARTGQPVDRDALVVELASEIMLQGDGWKPDYPALMARTGYGRSWCEKVVRDARRAALAERTAA